MRKNRFVVFVLAILAMASLAAPSYAGGRHSNRRYNGGQHNSRGRFFEGRGGYYNDCRGCGLVRWGSDMAVITAMEYRRAQEYQRERAYEAMLAEQAQYRQLQPQFVSDDRENFDNEEPAPREVNIHVDGEVTVHHEVSVNRPSALPLPTAQQDRKAMEKLEADTTPKFPQLGQHQPVIINKTCQNLTVLAQDKAIGSIPSGMRNFARPEFAFDLAPTLSGCSLSLQESSAGDVTVSCK